MLESYTLTLPKSGMDAVIAGLNELPYKIARPVIEEALRQFIAQEAPVIDAADAELAAQMVPAANDASAV